MPDIGPIPLLPPSLKEAVEKARLVVFVGAGVSRILGCAGWDDLARNLVKACNEAEYINFKEMESLTRESDHRKSISICYHIMVEDNKNPGLFYEHLERALQGDEELAKRYPIYDELHKLGAIYVTTNADELFDKLFIDQASICLADDFPDDSLDRTKLYHLHGKVTERSSLAFTVDQYIKRYSSLRIQAFLKKLFERYTILFVGYGLAELQLLEYLVLSNNKHTDEVRHYFLMPMFRGEEHLFEFQKDYYKKFGIGVIAYDITELGHNQLYKVVKDWQTRVLFALPLGHLYTTSRKRSARLRLNGFGGFGNRLVVGLKRRLPLTARSPLTRICEKGRTSWRAMCSQSVNAVRIWAALAGVCPPSASWGLKWL